MMLLEGTSNQSECLLLGGPRCRDLDEDLLPVIGEQVTRDCKISLEIFVDLQPAFFFRHGDQAHCKTVRRRDHVDHGPSLR